MPNIARTKPRPSVPMKASPPGQKTKILLVRQPVKSVRRSDEPDRSGLRLAIGVVAALGILAAVWLIGYLGFRLGFAETMRVRDLEIEGSGGLATGVMILITAPLAIVQMGIAQPLPLMLAFALIAIPAASLGAIEPHAPGGPKRKPAVVAVSFMGAIAGAINGGVLVWWAVSPQRRGLVSELPFDPGETIAWFDNLRIVGGLDSLGLVAAALWVVVIMRLAIPLWLRALTASMAFFALAVIAVAMARSVGTITHLEAARAVVFLDDGALDTQLVIGYTPQYTSTLKVENNAAIIELRNHPERLAVVGQQSIIDFLNERAPKREGQ